MENNFSYQNVPVRVITEENDQIWFAGIDVCNILGYEKPTQAIEKLDEDERKLDLVRQGSGQRRRTWILNESGLYSLIISSTKPEAKAFKRWVTHEVLPSIRKAGRYTTEQEQVHSAELQQHTKRIEELQGKIVGLSIQLRELRLELKETQSDLIDKVKNHNPKQTMMKFPSENKLKE